MKKKIFEAMLASLLIIVIVFGQVTQAIALDGVVQESDAYTITKLQTSGNIADMKTSEETASVSVVEETYGMKDTKTNLIKPVLIAAGGNHTLQIKNDGTVWAWGDNSYGQLGDGTYSQRVTPIRVKNLQNVVAVSAGYCYSLALKSDGTVWAWGGNYFKELGDETCSDSTIPIQVKGLNDIIAISAGYCYSLALKSDGTVWGWGDNFCKQLGNESCTESAKPLQVNGLSDVVCVSAGYNHSMALKSDGTVWVWGANTCGQLAGEMRADSAIPLQVNGLGDIKSVSAGDCNSLAVKSDGTVWLWGKSAEGVITTGGIYQHGTGTGLQSGVNFEFIFEPVQITGLSNVLSVAAGHSHILALNSSGKVWTFGNNDFGQLGNGNYTYSSDPIEVAELNDVKGIAVGWNHSVVQKIDYTVWSWGENTYGQLGDGTNMYKNIPVVIDDVVPPSVPTNLSATISESKVVLKWEESMDELGVASYEIYRDDVKIGSTSDITYIDSGIKEINKIHTYIIKACDDAGNLSEAAFMGINDKEPPTTPANLKLISKTATSVALEWEASFDNASLGGYVIFRNGKKVGQSKESNYIDINVPHNSTYTYEVKAFDKSYNYSSESNEIIATTDSLKAVPLAAGFSHSLEVKSDGTVWAWGQNDFGQLGNGTKITSSFCKQVYGIDNVVSVAAGQGHSIALRNDGTVWTWGLNTYKQLGDGTTVYMRTTPVQVKGLSEVIAIAAGTNHSLALKSDGTVWEWGQIGDSINKTMSIPMQVKNLSGVIAIAAGLYHCLAVKSDGTVWIWGSYYNDEWVRYNNIVPIQVNGLSDVATVAATANNNMVIKTDKTVWEWGYGFGFNSIPTKNTYLSEVSSISLGYSFALVLKSDGTVWSMGENYYGELGNGDNKRSYIPVQVNNLSGVTAISAGGSHSLALKSDGKVWAWGDNYYGQIGSIAGDKTNIPVLTREVISPTTPKNLTGMINEKKFTLTWGESTDNVAVAGYAVYRDDIKIASVTNTTYTDTDIDDINETHIYKVKAFDTSGNFSEAAIVALNDIGKPSIPSNLKATPMTSISVLLNWDASTDNIGVAGYEIYLNDIKIGTTTYTTFTDTNVKEISKPHIYTVKAFDTSGNLSEAVSVKLTDTGMPSIPIDLKATFKTATSVLLNWGASSDIFGVAGYEIYRDNIKIGTVTDTTYTDTYLKEIHEPHNYEVKALDVSGNLSQAASVQLKDIVMPSIPSNLKVTSKTATTVTLEWQPSTDNTIVEGYEIYIDGKKVGSSNTTSYTVSGLLHNKTFTFTIKAFDIFGNVSNASNSVKVLTDSLKSVPIAAGSNHSFVIIDIPLLWAWGDNQYGQLGDGTAVSATTALQLKSIKNIVAIEAGYSHSIALLNDGTVWAWGQNEKFQLGDGTTSNKYLPVQVNGLSDMVSISAGEKFNLAVKNDGTVWSWGCFRYGNEEDGLDVLESTPSQIAGLSNVVSAAVGGSHNLVLKNDGTVWAWGNNYYGQLGDEKLTYSIESIHIDELSDITAIAAGENYSLALKNDGTVWAWGYNDCGQLGNGTIINSKIPVQVYGLSNIVAISAGTNHNLALKGDGTVWAWGNNCSGQLGDGTLENRIQPVQVEKLSDIKAIAAGMDHSLALKNGERVWAWGSNEYGKLGDGTTTSRKLPVALMQADITYGDVDGSGTINSVDFAYMRQYLLGIIKEFKGENGMEAADVDGSGTFNSVDFAYMRKYLLGFISEFPAQAN